MKKTGLTIRIEDELREALIERAAKNNKTVSEHVRDVLWNTHFILM